MKRLPSGGLFFILGFPLNIDFSILLEDTQALYSLRFETQLTFNLI